MPRRSTTSRGARRCSPSCTRAEDELKSHRAEEEELARELVDTEERLAENQRRTDEALRRAAERLQEVEDRAAEAEARAERAEQLANAKAEEFERTGRLREMLDRIAEAEQRASSAEQRAREAVDRVAEPMPEIDTSAIFEDPDAPAHPESEAEVRPHGDALLEHAPPPEPAVPPEPAPPESAPPPAPEQTPEWFSSSLEPEHVAADPEPAADAPETPIPGSEVGSGPVRSTPPATRSFAARPLGHPDGRVLAYRERVGGVRSLDDLDQIPGFPGDFLTELKTKLGI